MKPGRIVKHVLRQVCHGRAIATLFSFITIVFAVVQFYSERNLFPKETMYAVATARNQVKIDFLYANSSSSMAPADYWRMVNEQISRESLYGRHFNWRKVIEHLEIGTIERAWLFSPNEKSYEDIPSDLGSTHKWFLQLEGQQQAIFKPFWDSDSSQKEFWYLGFESPAAEVISFHVDRLLGFRRVPYTAWRKIHLERDLFPFASESLLSIFERHGDEYCFEDKCYFCEEPQQTCTHSGYISGSISYFVDDLSPSREILWTQLIKYRNTETGVEAGVGNLSCHALLKASFIGEDRRSLRDLVDLAILDFLTYHFDSKLYTHLKTHTTVYIDRGRAFSRSDRDPPTQPLDLLMKCNGRKQPTVAALQRLIRRLPFLRTIVRNYDITEEKFSTDHIHATHRRAALLMKILRTFN